MKKAIVDPHRSQMHRRVLGLIRKLYPSFTVEEEKPVSCGRIRSLPVDLSIPQLRVCIECHGRQHFEHVAHFHATKEDFTAQQNRDDQKAMAIRNAGWSLVVIRFDEYEKMTPTQLAKRITKALKENPNGS